MTKSFRIITYMILFVWLIYYLLSELFIGSQIFQGLENLVVQTILDLSIIYVAFEVAKKNQTNRKLFTIIAISFLFVCFSDFYYNYVSAITNNIPKTYIIDPVDFPLVVFISLQLLAWCLVLKKSLKKIKAGIFFDLPILAIGMSIIIIYAYVFHLDERQLNSIQTIYQNVSVILEMISVFVALLCLVLSANSSLTLLLSGYLILISADFLARFALLHGTLVNNYTVQSIWSFGQMIFLIGLLRFKTVHAELTAKRWTLDFDSVQARFTLWTHTITLTSLCFFIALSLFFSKNLFLFKEYFLYNTPSVLIIFTVFSVLISHTFFKELLKPLKIVKEIFSLYSNYKYSDAEGKIPRIANDSHLLQEFKDLNIFISNSFKTLNEKLVAERHLAKLATQVAHDIRSPLLVLTRVLNDLSSLPEKRRIDARNAIQRVTDIANNLLAQYKGEKTILSSEPVAMMLESIISEKRIQIFGLNIEIKLNIALEVYNAFIQVDITSFKRVISNLINNAIEAVKTKDGYIIISAHRVNEKIFIKVSDNGCGIPKNKLQAVLEEGVSLGKKGGSGLGLSYAIAKISEWGGDYSLTSELEIGTQFEIGLSIVKPAEWFQETIQIAEGERIVVLDDDNYIHQIWDERFPKNFLEENNISLFHFYNPKDFIRFCEENDSMNTTFLLDYEIGQDNETGLSLAVMYNFEKKSILVTSRHEDNDLRESCVISGMKIIPKYFAEHVPIYILPKISLAEEKIVLIDDDEMITEIWKESAAYAGKSICVFHNAQDFIFHLNDYSKETLIYIDSSLGDNIKGEDVAKKLYEQGYSNIILATGYQKDDFQHVTWVKDIIQKNPPWE